MPAGAAPAAAKVRFIEFLKSEDGRLLDEDVLACVEREPRRLEVPIVGRRDADGIDRVRQELADRIGTREVLEVGNARPGRLLVLLGPAAGPAGQRELRRDRLAFAQGPEFLLHGRALERSPRIECVGRPRRNDQHRPHAWVSVDIRLGDVIGATKYGGSVWEKEITVTVGSELTVNAPLKK